MVGMKSVLFSAALPNCAVSVPSCQAVSTWTSAISSSSHWHPKAKAGPGKAEPGMHCNQDRKQQGLEGAGCW